MVLARINQVLPLPTMPMPTAFVPQPETRARLSVHVVVAVPYIQKAVVMREWWRSKLSHTLKNHITQSTTDWYGRRAAREENESKMSTKGNWYSVNANETYKTETRVSEGRPVYFYCPKPSETCPVHHEMAEGLNSLYRVEFCVIAHIEGIC